MRKINKYFMPAMLCLCISTAHAQDDNQDFIGFIGYGTQEMPYLINNADDLRLLQQYMASTREFSKGKYFKQTADISLNSNVLNDDGTLTADTANLAQWTPIGQGATLQSYYAFQGHFDGDGHTISGIYINDSTRQDLGLFGFIHKDGTVTNLKITDSYVLGTGAVGAIAGQLHDGNITYCESYATVHGVGPTLHSGGIVGQTSGSNGQILGCTNSGYVTSCSTTDAYGMRYNCDTGGICGSLGGAKIDSCQNLGTVVSQEWSSIGGIAGSVSGGAQIRWSVNSGYVSSLVRADIGGIVGNNWQTIRDCRNTGQVVATMKGSAIGGIVGICSWNSTVYDSENRADLVSDIDSVFVGGIVGNMNGHLDGTYYTPKMYRCTNYGAIVTTDAQSQAGGISGRNYLAEIHNSTNHGAVTSASRVGGITPSAEYHSAIKGCGNTGTIEGMKATGGIVGDTNESIDDCWNSGRIANLSSSYYAGGIVGYPSGSSSAVCGCVNMGEVCNTVRGGGIVGYNTSQSVIRECYNAGYVHSELEGAYLGGIGGGSGSIYNCYNAGRVMASGNSSTVSGVAVSVWLGNGQWGTISNSYNMGSVQALGSNSKAGSIVAVTSNTGRISNCYYLADRLSGDDFTNADNVYSQLTKLQESDFRTLAAYLNAGVDFPWDPVPFVQGYFRPVLQCTRNLLQPHYFEVMTLQGDSTLIDLGMPSDNTLFTTTETGQVLDAYNVLANDTVQRAILIDEKDFVVDRPFSAKELYYTRRLTTPFSSVCLPFEVSQQDLPEGGQMVLPQQIQDGTMVQTAAIDYVQAGQPFMIQAVNNTIWNLCKQDVSVVQEPLDGLHLLKGIFQMKKEWEPNCYLPLDETENYRRALSTDSLSAFRAYLQLAEASGDSLTIVTSIDLATNEAQTPGKPVAKAGNKCIRIDDAAGKTIRVYSFAGSLVSTTLSSRPRITVPVPRRGVYFVTVGGDGCLVMVE